MKRFLSIMLTVMLVLSSFVMVSASEDAFSVITVNDTYEHSFDPTYTGYYEISADIFVAQGATATMTVKNAEETVEAVTADTAKAGQWQTVKTSVNGNSFDSLVFGTEGGKTYIKAIRVDKKVAKTLVYEDDFEHYAVGDNALANNITKLYTNSSSIKATSEVEGGATSDFKVVSDKGNSAQVATLYYPMYRTEGVTKIKDDSSADDDSRVRQRIYDDTTKYLEGMEFYMIDIPEIEDATHVVVEMEVYNAANAIRDDDSVADTLQVTLGRSSTPHGQSSELAGVKLGAKKISVDGRNTSGKEADIPFEHSVPTKKWEKLTLDFQRDKYYDTLYSTDKYHVVTTATFDNKTYKNETYQAYADDFQKLSLSLLDDGGRFYIDNLKVYKVVDIDKAYVTRLEEDFDGADDVKGATPSGFYTSSTTKNTTFTIAGDYGKNTTQFGKLLNTVRETSDEYSVVFEDGTEPVVSVKGTNTKETFGIPVPGLEDKGTEAVGDKKNFRVSFRYYLPEAVTAKNVVRDQLNVGMVTTRLNDLNSGGTVRVAVNPLTTFVFKDSNQYETVTHNNGTKKWIPVVFEVESTYVKNGTSGNLPDDRYTHNIKYYSLNSVANSEITSQSGYDINNFCVGLGKTYAGLAYIDDIKVETLYSSAEDFAKLETTVETVYEKSAEIEDAVDEISVTAGTFGGDADSINIIKMPGNTGDVQVVTAIFEGNKLYDAAVNTVNVGELNVFAENTVTLTNKVDIPTDISEYSFKVFVFNTLDGLKPLADMLNKSVTVTPAE